MKTILATTFMFTIQTPSKTFTFHTQTLAEKQEWINIINESRDKQMEIEGINFFQETIIC